MLLVAFPSPAACSHSSGRFNCHLLKTTDLPHPCVLLSLTRSRVHPPSAAFNLLLTASVRVTLIFASMLLHPAGQLPGGAQCSSSLQFFLSQLRIDFSLLCFVYCRTWRLFSASSAGQANSILASSIQSHKVAVTVKEHPHNHRAAVQDMAGGRRGLQHSRALHSTPSCRNLISALLAGKSCLLSSKDPFNKTPEKAALQISQAL